MQNSLLTQRRWWWIAAFMLLLALPACIAQSPSVPPQTPAVEGATETPAEAATEEPTNEPATSASDGSASVSVSSDEVTSTTEISPEDALALIGGAAIPSEETYKGLPVGFTEEGFLYRGDPDAPIVMIEYSDFGCPFCNRYVVQTEPALDESYVRTGQVRVIYFDFPLVSLHPNAPAVHEASLCVADQSATAYWEYRAEVFRSVDEWQESDAPLPIYARLAEEIGVDMTAYEACMTSREKQAIVQGRVDTAFARGFNATPSFQVVRTTDSAIFELIGAQPYEQFAGAVDAALAGEMPVAAAAQPEQPQEQGIPFWATAEGWQPDPNRPGYNMAGDQYLGDINAPLTVIEFYDFQCPFCKRHNDETKPTLDEKYVDTGKVLWVYKHFPLNIHPQAPAAGIAAECGAEQGKFWEMHAALFESVEQWSIDDPTEVLISLATEAGLDADAFTACLSDPEMQARVDSDMAEGVQFVQGTPTFIIVRGQEGSIVPGALPEASFSKLLDEQLAAAGVTE